jgi:kynurenine 3-monooxygenase
MTGQTSFETVQNKNEIIGLFQTEFPDVLNMMPSLVEDFQTNPTGNLATIYCDPWHVEDKAVLLGDAAHAVVPFFGQGMNASFQDCSVLNNLIGDNEGNWENIYAEFSSSHVVNGHAIADMAIENYIEMRDSVNNPNFKKRRQLELELEKKYPGRFIPRYSMVSFHQIPYAEVYTRGEIQFELMNKFMAGKITDSDLHTTILNELQPVK